MHITYKYKYWKRTIWGENISKARSSYVDIYNLVIIFR